MTGRLDGRVAVVTGGMSGIGSAAVRRFLDEGAAVVAGDLRGRLLADLGADTVQVEPARGSPARRHSPAHRRPAARLAVGTPTPRTSAVSPSTWTRRRASPRWKP
ncbi:SDR family NAD(P)-dependent oxidoreductase [Streptomyces sp. BRA346]|uniref:SDR family NAD(P)-dependent oxidoreductase n=1 Tax=Streptomyces sp. BRA346 TaxID=2878199 RepID=UPI0040645C9D